LARKIAVDGVKLMAQGVGGGRGYSAQVARSENEKRGVGGTIGL